MNDRQHLLDLARTAPNPGETTLPEVRYDLQFSDDTSVLWRVREVEWTEATSAIFRLRVVALSFEASDPLALLGSDCTLTIDRAAVVRTIRGVVERIELVDDQAHGVRVELDVVPALALLDRGCTSRIWQNVSIPELVQSILVPALAQYDRELDASHLVGDYPAREYVVQHRESDFDFTCRLLAEVGIFYWFDHEREGGREVLVIEDSHDHVSFVPTMDDQPSIPQIRARHELAEVESIQRLSRRQELAPTLVSRRGFDWRTPSEVLETRAPDDQGRGDDPRGRVREVYQHEAIPEPRPRLAPARVLEQQTLLAQRCRGTSNVLGLSPGRRFSLGDQAEQLLLTQVHHHGADAGLDRDAGGAPEPSYANEFECVHFQAATPWRPPPRSRPRVTGPQTAIVTGPAGEEIHVDEHGRVKVWFVWDREHQQGDDSSVWIRVARDWAGSGFGSFFTPRIGMEVVVEFIDGDPDQPLITRCIHNGDNPPPVSLPASKTQSTIRTRSSPGGGGYNELRFEDAAGNEEIFVHAQRDLREEIGHDHATHVGADQRNTVDANQSERVRANQTLHVDGNRTKTIGGDEKVSVDGERTSSVGADEYLKVVGKTTHHHRANLEAWIVGLHQTIVQSTQTPAMQTTRVEGSHSLDVDDASTTTAAKVYTAQQGNAHDPDVSLHFEAGRSQHFARRELVAHAGELLESSSDDAIEFTAAKSLTASQGAASLTLKEGVATLEAREIRLISGETMLVISPSGISIQTPQFDLEALGSITITGSTTLID